MSHTRMPKRSCISIDKIMEQSLVYLAETEDRISFVNNVLEKVRADFTRTPGLKVFVKPNIVSSETYPTTTHPQVLASVLDFLFGCGCQIVVADGPAVDAGNAQKVIADHPLSEVCNERGIELQNLHGQGFTRVTAGSMHLEVSRLAFDCDRIISLPVLKAHGICRMTGALKNQLGLLHNRDRIMMHIRLKSLGKGIAGINSIVKPNFYIVDAIETYRNTNERRHGGSKASLGYMLAGTDPVALDSLGLKLLQRVETKLHNTGPEDIDYIAHAFKLGLGSIDYQVEPIIGK